jgi:hypothetical protein
MMGRLNRDQGQLFYCYNLEEAVPDDHQVRRIAEVLALSWVRAELAHHSSPLGHPSIDPVLMIRMLIVGYVFAIRSERVLCREVEDEIHGRSSRSINEVRRFDAERARRDADKHVARNRHGSRARLPCSPAMEQPVLPEETAGHGLQFFRRPYCCNGSLGGLCQRKQRVIRVVYGGRIGTSPFRKSGLFHAPSMQKSRESFPTSTQAATHIAMLAPARMPITNTVAPVTTRAGRMISNLDPRVPTKLVLFSQRHHCGTAGRREPQQHNDECGDLHET